MDPFATATSLVGAIGAGELSAVEALDETLARVERVNPQINAIVALDEEQARAAAAAADAALGRGRDARPAARAADDDQGLVGDRGPRHRLRRAAIWPSTFPRPTRPRWRDCAAPVP